MTLEVELEYYLLCSWLRYENCDSCSNEPKVAFQFVVGASIPRTSYSTLLDQYITLSYLFLVMPCIESVVVSEMASSETQYYVDTAKKVDTGVLIASAIAWVLSCIIFAFVAKRKVVKRKKAIKVPVSLTTKED